MIAEKGFFGGDIETIFNKPASVVLDTYYYIKFKADFRQAIEQYREREQQR